MSGALEGMLWRPIPGWPYEASEAGDIRSQRTGKVLRPKINGKGYACVSLQVDKVRREARVHRLVVEAWVGPIEAGLQVNHINGIKLDNRPINLEITTAVENTRHAARNGLMATGARNGMRLYPESVPRGENCNLAKLSSEDVLAIRRLHAEGAATFAIAAEFRTSRFNVWQIVKRKTWRHLPEEQS